MWRYSAARFALRLLFLELCLACLLWKPAFCSLGDDVSSVAADQAYFKSTARVMVMPSYSVHEMRTPVGTIIRQFVSPSGTVFGVAWQGFSPDLQQLLGSHFEEYVSAASQPAARGRGVHIETGDLVVETGGHMRFVVGHAFLRSKMPLGVHADDLH